MYVKVCNSLGDMPVEVPHNNNFKLPLSTLQSLFPGACGLKFFINNGEAFRGVRCIDGVLAPPDGGWEKKVFICVYPKEAMTRLIYSSVQEIEDRRKTKDLIVLGLPFKITELILGRFLEDNIGPLRMCMIKRDAETRVSKGFGFIRFEEYKDQAKAISLRKFRLFDRWINIKPPTTKEGVYELPSKIFLGRLQPDMKKQLLGAYFEKFGDILDIYIPEPFQNIGFITFVDPESAQAAAREDHIIRGSSIYVSVASVGHKHNAKMKSKIQRKNTGGNKQIASTYINNNREKQGLVVQNNNLSQNVGMGDRISGNAQPTNAAFVNPVTNLLSAVLNPAVLPTLLQQPNILSQLADQSVQPNILSQLGDQSVQPNILLQQGDQSVTNTQKSNNGVQSRQNFLNDERIQENISTIRLTKQNIEHLQNNLETAQQNANQDKQSDKQNQQNVQSIEPSNPNIPRLLSIKQEKINDLEDQSTSQTEQPISQISNPVDQNSSSSSSTMMKSNRYNLPEAIKREAAYYESIKKEPVSPKSAPTLDDTNSQDDIWVGSITRNVPTPDQPNLKASTSSHQKRPTENRSYYNRYRNGPLPPSVDDSGDVYIVDDEPVRPKSNFHDDPFGLNDDDFPVRWNQRGFGQRQFNDGSRNQGCFDDRPFDRGYDQNPFGQNQGPFNQNRGPFNQNQRPFNEPNMDDGPWNDRQPPNWEPNFRNNFNNQPPFKRARYN